MPTHVKRGLVLGFPLFLFFICELGHLQSIPRLFSFIAENFAVMLFDLLIIGALFAVLSLLFRRVLIAAALEGVVFMVLSAVEYYKFTVSGTHLSLADLAMTTNVGDLTQFANLQFNAVLAVCSLLLLAYLFLLFKAKVRINLQIKFRAVTAMAGALVLTVVIAVPDVFNPVCTVFGVENTQPAVSVNDNGFDNNNLIASLVVSANSQVASIVKKPDGYGEQAVEALMALAGEAGSGLRPNVLFIMSESFADFRRLSGVPVPEGTYDAFDAVAARSYVGNTVVPTFGGHTVRTEFELMFGLPVRSLNNAPIPHKLLDEDTGHETFAQLFQNMGYHTAYIHPFSSTFYDRDEFYGTYGYDQLIFEEDMTVDTDKFRAYMDDAAVFAQVGQQMAQTQGPDYLYVTTMQNHQPYLEDGKSELEVYLDGVRHSAEVLEAFVQQLDALEEPTVLVFLGDHYPSFTAGDDVYAALPNSELEKLYDQPYLVYANYDIDFSAPETVSAFYLPHLVYRALFGQGNAFVNTVLGFMDRTPVYAVSDMQVPANRGLDMLAYDRSIGKQYSRE